MDWALSVLSDEKRNRLLSKLRPFALDGGPAMPPAAEPDVLAREEALELLEDYVPETRFQAAIAELAKRLNEASTGGRVTHLERENALLRERVGTAEERLRKLEVRKESARTGDGASRAELLRLREQVDQLTQLVLAKPRESEACSVPRCTSAATGRAPVMQATARRGWAEHDRVPLCEAHQAVAVLEVERQDLANFRRLVARIGEGRFWVRGSDVRAAERLLEVAADQGKSLRLWGEDDEMPLAAAPASE